MIVFILGFLSLYTSSSWTLVRGINIALIFSMYWIIYTKKQIYIIFCILGLINFGGFINYYKNDMVGLRISKNEYLDKYNNNKELLSKYVEISENKSKWDNTVIIYQDTELYVPALPIGAGVNGMFDYKNSTPDKAGYVLISKDFKDYINITINKNLYYIIYEDSDIILYERLKSYT